MLTLGGCSRFELELLKRGSWYQERLGIQLSKTLYESVDIAKAQEVTYQLLERLHGPLYCFFQA